MSDEIHIDTLGAFLDYGYSFDLWCPQCQRGRSVTAERFVEKLGRGHSLKVGRYIRCSGCGGKGVEVRISPPTPDVNRTLS